MPTINLNTTCSNEFNIFNLTNDLPASLKNLFLNNDISTLNYDSLGISGVLSAEVFERTVKNPFFWAVTYTATSVAAITFSAALLSFSAAMPITLCVFTLAGITTLNLEVREKKWIFSELSLLHSKILELIPSSILKYNWYNEITPNITLGAAPLKSQGHFDEIKQTHQSVLSMIQAFEHESHLLGVPAKAEDWNTAGLSFLNLPNPDLTPVRIEDVQRGVEWLHEQISQNKKVYVHCLAGVGRSATIVICYLIKYGHLSPSDAVALVNSKRRIAVDENSPAIRAYISQNQNVN